MNVYWNGPDTWFEIEEAELPTTKPLSDISSIRHRSA